jgi:hypothetical protein
MMHPTTFSIPHAATASVVPLLEGFAWKSLCIYQYLAAGSLPVITDCLIHDMQDPGCPYYSDSEDEKAAKGLCVLL